MMKNKRYIFILSVFIALILLKSSNVFADQASELGFNIGGKDETSLFPQLTNIFHTVAVIAVQYVARIIGACLCIYGLFTAAMKDKIAGIVAIGFGAALLFLPTILQEFITFGQNTGG